MKVSEAIEIKERVRAYLKEHKNESNRKIGDVLGYTRAQIYYAVERLKKYGFIKKGEDGFIILKPDEPIIINKRFTGTHKWKEYNLTTDINRIKEILKEKQSKRQEINENLFKLKTKEETLRAKIAYLEEYAIRNHPNWTKAKIYRESQRLTNVCINLEKVGDETEKMICKKRSIDDELFAITKRLTYLENKGKAKQKQD